MTTATVPQHTVAAWRNAQLGNYGILLSPPRDQNRSPVGDYDTRGEACDLLDAVLAAQPGVHGIVVQRTENGYLELSPAQAAWMYGVTS